MYDDDEGEDYDECEDDDEDAGRDDDPVARAACVSAMTRLDAAYEAAERKAFEAYEAAERKAFGKRARQMCDLLSVHKLPHGWEDGKQWLRIFNCQASPLDEAAAWLDAGWTNAEAVEDAFMVCSTPQEALRRLTILGASVAEVQSHEVVVSRFDDLGLMEVLGSSFDGRRLSV